ncbi:MAG: hypothetical protein ACI4U0_00470 [Candidatus Aphodocola sp.]
MFTIKRVKYFCGALVPYNIVINYDIGHYKELLERYNNLNKIINITDNDSVKQLKIVADEINKIKYAIIKNGEEITIEDDVKSIFDCLNDLDSDSVYIFTYSNQVNIKPNKNYEIITKFYWKKNEFIIKEK